MCGLLDRERIEVIVVIAGGLAVIAGRVVGRALLTLRAAHAAAHGLLGAARVVAYLAVALGIAGMLYVLSLIHI